MKSLFPSSKVADSSGKLRLNAEQLIVEDFSIPHIGRIQLISAPFAVSCGDGEFTNSDLTIIRILQAHRGKSRLDDVLKMMAENFSPTTASSKEAMTKLY